MTLSRLRKNTPKILLGAILPAFAVAALVAFSQTADTQAAQRPNDASELKSTGSSVIRTSDPTKAKAAIASRGLKAQKTIQLPNGDELLVVNTPAASDNAKAIKQQMKSDRSFKLATNHRYQPTTLSNDPLLTDGSQWNINKIAAPAGWDITTGSSDVTIAVLDTGVLSNQSWQDSPDCSTAAPCTQRDFPAEKMWSNTGETGATTTEGTAPNCTSRNLTLDKSCNNIDDDGNGFIDDHQGWDFMGGWRGTDGTCPNYHDGTTYNNPDYPGYVSNDNDPQPYSCDSYKHTNALNMHHNDGSCTNAESACYTHHGTAIGSVATSATNNDAIVAGVNWNAKVMSVRAMDAYGWTDSAHVTAAVEYASAMNADVINASLAIISGSSCSISDALLDDAMARATANGTAIVAASGNGGSQGVCYPANSKHTIAVGASDQNDNRASFSTYGPELDVIAPGVDVPAAVAPAKGKYNYQDYGLNTGGTSVATPHVAGLVGLLRSIEPNLTAKQLKSAIQRGAVAVPEMSGKWFTYQHGFGRIDVHKTLSQDLTTLDTPRYVNFDTALSMKVASSTQKTDLVTGLLTGPTISRNTVLSMGSETYINGIRYLRTSEDTNANLHLGIPESYLRTASTKPSRN